MTWGWWRDEMEFIPARRAPDGGRVDVATDGPYPLPAPPSDAVPASCLGIPGRERGRGFRLSRCPVALCRYAGWRGAWYHHVPVKAIVPIIVALAAWPRTAAAVDVFECLREGDCWLEDGTPVLKSDSLAVKGWSRLYLELRPEREDVEPEDCSVARIGQVFSMRYHWRPGFRLVGCRGDFDGDSRIDYCLLMHGQNDCRIVPYVFLGTTGPYRAVALEEVFDPYGTARDSTSCPGPYRLAKPADGLFEFPNYDDGTDQYRSVGDLIQVGWHTYAWTDSGFSIAHMAD